MRNPGSIQSTGPASAAVAVREAAPAARAREETHAPLVSVVIPCYNQARFLGEAIESVLRQTNRRFEVIVVDDGSPDDTAGVAARYAGVRYVRQANQGLAGARNTGIREARGRYLVFLDADDVLLPAALEAGLNAFDAHPECAFVYGAHLRMAADGAPLDAPFVRRVDGDAYRALLRGNVIGMHAAVMYRRDALEAAGGFDTSLPACEDYDLYLRLARRAPVYGHGEVAAAYRRHASNMSNNPEMMLRAVLAVLRAHRRRTPMDRRSRQAYREGLRTWKAYYGQQFLSQNVQPAPSMIPLVRLAPLWMVRLWISDFRWRIGHTWHPLRREAAPTDIVHPHSKIPNRFPLMLLLARQESEDGFGPSLFGRFVAFGKTALPASVRRRLWPEASSGPVRFGDLRRLTPISRTFGYDRGLPVDRYYIEGFLKRHAGDIRGRVLEVGDDAYTRRFGATRVTRSDVLHVAEGNPQATIVGDLATAGHIPSDAFDCIILTQTLHLIYDLRAAMATLYRILKPGGVLLATVPGISQIDHGEWRGTWYWSFTARSAARLVEEAFPPDQVTVTPHGNVLAATAFLHGLARQELRRRELAHQDSDYQLLITIRAVKPAAIPHERP